MSSNDKDGSGDPVEMKGCPVCGSPTCKCKNCVCTDEMHCSMATSVIQSLQQHPGSINEDPLAGKTLMDEDKNEVELTIDGMSCVNCSNSIEQAVKQLEGISSIRINLGTDSARISWKKGSKLSPGVIKETIEDIGYDVTIVGHFTPETEDTGAGDEKQTAKDQVVDIVVSGMTCSMCSQAIENSLNQLGGSLQVNVALATDTVHVSWDPQQHTVDEIKAAIEDVGYDIEDIHYPETSNNVDTAEEGGNVDNTSTQNEAVEVRWQRLSRRQEEKVQKRRRAFVWSLVGTLPVLVLTMVVNHLVHRGFLFHHIRISGREIEIEAFMLWILATPVQFVAGFEFYRMSYFSLKSGRAGMDVLVALGTSASYFYALAGAWRGDDMAAHFFETSAVLICFVLAGKWLQALAVRRTSEALTKLMHLQSKTAVKVVPVEPTKNSSKFNPLVHPFSEAVVSIQEVVKGDILKIIRGASIPADGRVLFGAMSVDESMVTGESMPVLKSTDAIVLGGTVCVECSINDDQGNSGASVGAAFVEVTGVGSATALAQIIQLVQDAQTRSVPIQTFADTVSAIFVPTVCLISLLTYMTWYALCSSRVVPSAWYEDLGEDPTTFSLMFGIACLVISCPCALGLATPTAVMVGTGVGAKVGVLMKGGEALEVASKVDSVIFDKTGTLTKGKPVITDFVRVDVTRDKSDEELLWLLGCLERTSEHPLAKAVVGYVEEHLGGGYLEQKPFVEPTHFRALTGRGASGLVLDTVAVAAGNRSFAAEQRLSIPREAEKAMLEMEFLGKTAILVAVDSIVSLVLGLADELKPGAKESISYLKDEMNIDVWMVTGDNGRTARAIAAQLGLPSNRVVSEALPAAKVQQVRKLQKEDHLVAMIGDGINDSPALAEADVGISVGTAAEIAAEASDLVLVKGDVQDVCTALHLSRAIFRRIQLNLVWSLLYNTLGIPLAAGLFYPFVQMRLPPTIAALAMALSSVSVVLSSLSMRFYKPPEVFGRRRRQQGRLNWMWGRTASGEPSDSEGSGELQQDLLSNDFLSHVSVSEFTESTAVVDNRTSVEDLNFDVA